MRLAVINPSSTVSMTDKIAAAARAAALSHLLAEVQAAYAAGADACIIACFDATGLAAARKLVPIPVRGIGGAAFHAAMLLGHHYSVVSTLSISVPVIVDTIKTFGLGSHCLNVRASDIPVLDLEKPGTED